MGEKVISVWLIFVLTACMLAGCSSKKKASVPADSVTEFTCFIAASGPEMPEINDEIDDDNEIARLIAEKSGVRVREEWQGEQASADAIAALIESGEYPDFVYSDEIAMLADAGALVALDDYIDRYPVFRDTWFTQDEWEKFRQADGHIYWIDPFGNTMGKSRQTLHSGEAFWIQVRVLEWAGYPEIKTVEQYFDLLERYMAENPVMKIGTDAEAETETGVETETEAETEKDAEADTDEGIPNIAYTILCEEWRAFCFENAGQFLAGYPKDGSVVVNRETMQIEDYNTSEDTKAYFRKLNEEYQKGFVDPESFTQTYSEYIEKLSTGCVLGMLDYWWDFAYTVNDVFRQQGLDQAGCNYVPLGLTTRAGMENRWHAYADTVDSTSGIAITTACADPEKAFRFLVNLAMVQELHDLRFWGIEDVDYKVDEEGLYYRTEEQRMQWADAAYQASHCCKYSFFPQWYGTSLDGKNANRPEEQPSEFMCDMAEPLKKCFEAYGVTTYPDMIGSVVEENAEWFPMYSFSNKFTTETPGGVAWAKMEEVKREWLPKVVEGDDFEVEWADYMEAYKAARPEDFIDEMQAILDTFK